MSDISTKTYKVNEIFYSLQGEGYWTGTPSVFIRFSGCNLRCPFCDTQHEQGDVLSLEAIVEKVCSYPATHIVLTGGEPSLFIDDILIAALHSAGKFIAIETNGTHALPAGIDWITLSPKDSVTENATVVLKSCHELKLVYTSPTVTLPPNVHADWYFLQPCDTGDAEQNSRILQETIAYIKAHPQWRLSLQTHKIAGIR